jgi:hypothetical protein
MIEILLVAVKYDRYCLHGINLYEYSILSCCASMNFILMKREINSHEIFFFQFRLADHLCKIMEINVYLYECMHAVRKT